jgi:hypothetical protein
MNPRFINFRYNKACYFVYLFFTYLHFRCKELTFVASATFTCKIMGISYLIYEFSHYEQFHVNNCLRKSSDNCIWIFGSHSGDYDEYCLLACPTILAGSLGIRKLNVILYHPHLSHAVGSFHVQIRLLFTLIQSFDATL